MESYEVAIVGVAAAFVIGSLIASAHRQKKLEDPSNTDVIYLDQLTSVSKLLGVGSFRLSIYRQSGNPQQKDQYFKTGPEAIHAAVSTFKRAKIEYAVVLSNSESELCFRRPDHSHGGKQEGKKVGRAEIHRMG